MDRTPSRRQQQASKQTNKQTTERKEILFAFVFFFLSLFNSVVVRVWRGFCLIEERKSEWKRGKRFRGLKENKHSDSLFEENTPKMSAIVKA